MTDGSIAAVVPVWNRRELVATVLGTLRAQSAAPKEVIVVDNGSTDGAAEEAEQAGARVIRMGENAGFAAAVNRGIGASRSEWVAVINNDVELAPDYLARLLGTAQAGNAWFATGKILASERRDTIDATFDVLSRGGCSWRVGHGEPDGPEYSVDRSIFSAPWTAVLIRKTLLDTVGLLDESFGSYLEDAEFGARCARAGCAGKYVPLALAWHKGSATLGAWSPAMVRLIARNQVSIAARHLALRDAWHIFVAQSAWGLLAFRHRAGRAWLRGKWEGIRKAGSVCSTSSPGDERLLREWLNENERMLRRARSRYWRTYSILTPGEAI